MRSITPTFMMVAAATCAAPFSVAAQSPSRIERIEFARGTSSKTMSGSVAGYQTVDYVLRAESRQTLDISLQAANRFTYFNLVGPDGSTIFDGPVAGSRFQGALAISGDYRIRVFLMRNAARRGERARFTLSTTVTTRPGNGGVGGVGEGRPVAPSNMPAFCRGEASQQYSVRPAYITTHRPVRSRAQTTIDGSADQGANGTKRFRCRFDAAGRFIDVMALTPDGL